VAHRPELSPRSSSGLWATDYEREKTGTAVQHISRKNIKNPLDQNCFDQYLWVDVVVDDGADFEVSLGVLP